MRKRWLLATMLVGMVPPAAGAETVLHVADTATVMVAPDEFAASLQAEALLSTAAAAQGQVNEIMKESLAIARAADGSAGQLDRGGSPRTPSGGTGGPGGGASGDTGRPTGAEGRRAGAPAGIVASTGNYAVWRIGTESNQPERWQATQMLNLSGPDDVAILALVGRLQQKGLAVGSLGWRLSHRAEQKARQDATRQALSGLRGRIDDAASVLGLRFGQFKEVRLDSAARAPLFARAMGAAVAAGRAATPPNAVPEDVAVTVTVEADALLQPR